MTTRGLTQSGAATSSDLVDVLIVGAGFAGLYMLHHARQLGLSAQILEAGSDVGGTWYWNRYPGLRCDVESMQYSYSFLEDVQQEWPWTERFSKQSDILRYLKHVADRLDLYRDIRFDTRVESATWHEATAQWLVRSGELEMRARFCVLATGALSAVQLPALDGAADFAGEIYHTGAWPEHGVDLAGKRVGIIGTGSSGIQIIPELAKAAKSLHVFQRTAPYVFEARNAELSDGEIGKWKNDYPARRARAKHEPAGVLFDQLLDKSVWEVTDEERHAEYSRLWDEGGPAILATFNDVMIDKAANDTLADFVRAKIADVVDDPETVRKLTPNVAVGAKRPPFGTNYYATFNRDNVDLVNLRETPITRILPTGIETSAATIPLEVLVFATGYDAITGALSRIDIRGRAGGTLRQKWIDGPRAYLGIMSAGFPNLFLITGPGSPSVLTNVVAAIEQHIEWVAGCLAHLGEAGVDIIEPEVEAESNWVAHVNEVSAATLYPTVESWYNGTNVPGKPRGFIPYAGGLGEYRKTADEIAASGYRGFHLAAGEAKANEAQAVSNE